MNRQDQSSVTIEVVPERKGFWSVGVVDRNGEIIDADLNLELVRAIGVATRAARRYGVTYRIVDAPADVSAN